MSVVSATLTIGDFPAEIRGENSAYPIIERAAILNFVILILKEYSAMHSILTGLGTSPRTSSSRVLK